MLWAECYHMRKHIWHIVHADGRNEFVRYQNPAVEFLPTLEVSRWTIFKSLNLPKVQ